MKSFTRLFSKNLKATTALIFLGASSLPVCAMDDPSVNPYLPHSASRIKMEKEGFEEVKVNFQSCVLEDLGEVTQTGAKYTIVTTGKKSMNAPYVVRSDVIEFQEGDILRVLYDVEVTLGGASIGILSSTTKNWVEDFYANPSEDAKYPTMHRTFLAAPWDNAYKGVFERTALANETGASVIFRSFHALEDNDISIFTLTNPTVFKKRKNAMPEVQYHTTNTTVTTTTTLVHPEPFELPKPVALPKPVEFTYEDYIDELSFSDEYTANGYTWLLVGKPMVEANFSDYTKDVAAGKYEDEFTPAHASLQRIPTETERMNNDKTFFLDLCKDHGGAYGTYYYLKHKTDESKNIGNLWLILKQEPEATTEKVREKEKS